MKAFVKWKEADAIHAGFTVMFFTNGVSGYGADHFLFYNYIRQVEFKIVAFRSHRQFLNAPFRMASAALILISADTCESVENGLKKMV